MRRFLIAAAVVSMTVSAFGALSPQHEAWGKSGVKFLFTDEEAAAWKAVRTDEQAQAFADLFWARRDPTPATPKNEYRDVIEERIRYADEHFTTGRKRTPGSQTDRGMMLIVFGQPNTTATRDKGQQLGVAGRTAERAGGSTGTPQAALPAGAQRGDQQAYQIWLYEGEHVPALFGVPRAEFKFTDVQNNDEYMLDRMARIGQTSVDVNKWRRTVNAAKITQPQLTKAPEFTNVSMAGSSVAPAPVVTTLTTPSLSAAVTEVKAAAANPYASQAYATFGEYVTVGGHYFVPVSLYIPKASAAAASQNVTFFGVVEDESGKPVLAFEEPVTLTATKEDFFVDKSLTLPAGKQRGFFGIAANGKPLALVPVEMNLAGTLDKAAPGISQLILSNNIYALSEAQNANDPYAFGGTKVIPKGDKTFKASSDELWYFFEMRNPGIAEDTKTPKVQVKIEITGKATDGQSVRKAGPLSEVEPMELKGVEGHWAVGNAFPLTSFKPGDYTINMKVIDTVTKASYTLSDTFKVVP